MNKPKPKVIKLSPRDAKAVREISSQGYEWAENKFRAEEQRNFFFFKKKVEEYFNQSKPEEA